MPGHYSFRDQATFCLTLEATSLTVLKSLKT